MAAGIIGRKAARTSGISSVSGTSKNKPAQTYAQGQLHYSTSSSDASALASMNKIRAQQGLAPQTQIGVKAPSRSSSTGPTTVDTKTNTVKDRQGNVLATGSSLSEALAKQTQLSTGSAPSVAGRPDLYAVAPGKNQEVKPYYDASTKTTVTPTTATSAQLGQAASGTLQSFNKAQGLTYLDAKTFKDLQPVLNNNDLIRGPNGQIWLRQGLSVDQVAARKATPVAGLGGATGDTLASDFSVDVPDTISTDTIAALTETPVTETDFNQMLAQMQAKQEELLGLMAPGADELATKAQINDIKAQVEKSLTELSMGLNNVEDQPIAMQFIAGQQASIQRSADAKLQNLARIETNLLNELGLEQDARKVKASVAQTQLGYLQTNLDTAFKVRQMIQQEEDSAFSKAMTLKNSAQNTFATILDSMRGMDESDMTDDQKNQLQGLAASAGIPYSLVVAGLSTVKKQMMATTAGITPTSGITYSTDADAITNAIKSVESGGNYSAKGASGEFGAYQFMPATWEKWSSEYAQGTGQGEQSLDMTPANQDAVAKFKVRQWLDQGYQADQIASMWNSGSPDYAGKIGTNSKGVKYDVPGYVSKVLAAVPSQVAPQVPTQDAVMAAQDAYNAITDLEATPGFNAAIGFGIAKHLPGNLSAGTDAATYLSRLDAVKAKLTLELLPKMKGMGALSDADRQFLMNSIGALNPNMSETEFTKSLAAIKQKLTDTLTAGGITTGGAGASASSSADMDYLTSLGL